MPLEHTIGLEALEMQRPGGGLQRRLRRDTAIVERIADARGTRGVRDGEWREAHGPHLAPRRRARQPPRAAPTIAWSGVASRSITFVDT